MLMLLFAVQGQRHWWFWYRHRAGNDANPLRRGSCKWLVWCVKWEQLKNVGHLCSNSFGNRIFGTEILTSLGFFPWSCHWLVHLRYFLLLSTAALASPWQVLGFCCWFHFVEHVFLHNFTSTFKTRIILSTLPLMMDPGPWGFACARICWLESNWLLWLRGDLVAMFSSTNWPGVDC